MTLDERRERLLQWFDVIFKDVTEAIINDHVFWEVQDVIRQNPVLQNASSAFFVWMATTFVHSSVLSVRRQVDTARKCISLHRFLLELEMFPELISREFHLSYYKRSEYSTEHGQIMGNFTYDKYVGSGRNTLDPAEIRREISELLATTKVLHHYADRSVAHYDSRGLKEPVPRFDDLRECLRTLERLVLRYQLLLRAAWQDTLMPTFQYDWKSVFRTQWIQ